MQRSPSFLQRLPSEPAQQIGAATADLLFPQACFACGGALTADNRAPAGACRACYDELTLIHDAGCQRCGAPAVQLGDAPRVECGVCSRTPLRFDSAIAAGVYEGLLRYLILRAKQVSEEATALALGRLMVARGADWLRQFKPDLVTTIPMHWRRRLVRQTNSPELMAEVIANELNLPVETRLLRRLRATRPQTELARSSRLPNVRQAFAVRKGYDLRGATVVLVDDILTTGATCSEAARALKQGGAGQVVAIVAARSL